MNKLTKQLQDYASGKAGAECPHPINKIVEAGHKDVCCLCGKVVFIPAFREVDFDPATMTRATNNDIARIWKELWGDSTVLYILGRFEAESGEYLDRTQTNVILE